MEEQNKETLKEERKVWADNMRLKKQIKALEEELTHLRAENGVLTAQNNQLKEFIGGIGL